MKIYYFIFFSLIVLLPFGCGPDKKELCDCVTTDTGEWDMYLSKECQQKMIDTFGPDLNGMEEWFRENCERISHPKLKDEPGKPIAI